MHFHKALENLSIEELETLAINLHERYFAAEKRLRIRREPPRENDIRHITGEPSLDEVLQERRWRLNHAFRFTPETLARFVEISDRLTACMKKAWEEAKPELDALERRLKNGDPFLKDYELDWKVEPYIGKEGIYEVLEEVAHGSSAILDRHARTYEACALEMDCDETWGADFAVGHEELENQRIGYAMHELYDHSCWSVPDILKIENIWVDVVIRRQYFEEGV